jgi:hypothetical protein
LIYVWPCIINVGKVNMEHQLDATITFVLIFKISSTHFGQAFAHLHERHLPRIIYINICISIFTGHYTICCKKISVLRSWRWAKACPKHVELILKINKTVIVASRWCFIFTLPSFTSLLLLWVLFAVLFININYK